MTQPRWRRRATWIGVAAAALAAVAAATAITLAGCISPLHGYPWLPQNDVQTDLPPTRSVPDPAPRADAPHSHNRPAHRGQAPAAQVYGCRWAAPTANPNRSSAALLFGWPVASRAVGTDATAATVATRLATA